MSELIGSTRDSLKQILPEAQKIDIRVNRDHELIRTRISVLVPGATLYAEKKAANVSEALESSYQAMLKQIEKLKTKRRPRTRQRRWDAVLGPP